jgi:hypothetical protein
VNGGALELRGAFLAVLDALGDAGIAHAFIGALPVLAWGRVRATTDIDLVVLAGDEWHRLTEALRQRGFRAGRVVGPSEPSDKLPDISVFHGPGHPSVRIDVFIAKTEFERTVIETARTAAVLGTTVRLARPEGSIIYKLLASRPKDLDDVEAIFEARRTAGDMLDWSFLDYWAVEWSIADRLAPYRRRFRPGTS